VSLCVFLNKERQYKFVIEGDEGFEDGWEKIQEAISSI
jgi:hypothetical protein